MNVFRPPLSVFVERSGRQKKESLFRPAFCKTLDKQVFLPFN
jgi:hypothetical protein